MGSACQTEVMDGSGRRRAGLGLTLVVAVLAVGASQAWAGLAVNLGSSHGLRYRSISPAASVAAGSSGERNLSCAGDAPVGGGIFVNGNTAEAKLTSSTPYFSDQPTGPDYLSWYAGFQNDTGSPKTFTVFGICRQAGFAGLRYRHRPNVLPPGEQSTAKARCGRRSSLLGGGVIGSSGKWISSSYPIDGNDADHRPDDGWAAKQYNSTALLGGTTVYAICTKQDRDKITYVKGEKTLLDAGGGFANVAACPSDSAVVDGGASIAGPGATAFLQSSLPVDIGDANNTIPEDEWRVPAYVTAGTDRATRAYAICFG